jgi:uncharacterized integral membrane protein (TIGR00698 family)
MEKFKKMSLITNILTITSGILFLFIVGLLGRFIGDYIPYINYLIICIFLGLLISNITELPAIIDNGILSTHKVFLEAGIVILGARVILSELITIGPSLLILVLSFLLFYIITTHLISRLFNLEPRFGSTLACGLGICGVSAAIAVGGALQIKGKDLAYIIGVILVIDVITVFMWPIIGTIFSLPSEVFGTWVGVSMLSTGTAVAAGFSHSNDAGELATIIKMARNSTIGIWALIFTANYAKKGMARDVTNKISYFWNIFPKFVLGFIFVMTLSNAGLISVEQLTSIENAYGWLFMMAFVGLGYDINLREVRRTGIKPLIVALIAVLLTSVISLVTLHIIF